VRGPPARPPACPRRQIPPRVSEAELRLIEADPQPPASCLLLGRSGTGKT
jgi:hypothetical protein